MYKIEKNLNRIYNNQSTFFLNPKDQELLKGKLKKNEYKIYYPYKDSEKNIFYTKELPNVLLYEVKSKIELKHQDILGTMFSLDISDELFGDILLIDGHYYIYILDILRNYFETNFNMIKNSSIELINLDIDYLKYYEKDYELIELIVSSCRIDTVISTLIKTGRNIIKDKQKDKEILVNYDFVKDISRVFKEGDVFSIRKYGKYKFKGIKKNTKSGNYIVEILKYK